MAFKLTIKTDNAAFGDGDDSELGHELAAILRNLARHLEEFANLRGGSVRDSNGNTVGTYTLT